MFILESNKKALLKRVILYVGITAFIALFGIVYEQFSHNVNSFYMWFAWIFVLAGLIPYLILFAAPIKWMPGPLTECVYNFGVAMLTVRSVFIGVLEIYGKTGVKMELAYTVLAIVFLTGGIVLYIFGLFLPKKDTNI